MLDANVRTQTFINDIVNNLEECHGELGEVTKDNSLFCWDLEFLEPQPKELFERISWQFLEVKSQNDGFDHFTIQPNPLHPHLKHHHLSITCYPSPVESIAFTCQGRHLQELLYEIEARPSGDILEKYFLRKNETFDVNNYIYSTNKELLLYPKFLHAQPYSYCTTRQIASSYVGATFSLAAIATILYYLRLHPYKIGGQIWQVYRHPAHNGLVATLASGNPHSLVNPLPETHIAYRLLKSRNKKVTEISEEYFNYKLTLSAPPKYNQYFWVDPKPNPMSGKKIILSLTGILFCAFLTMLFYHKVANSFSGTHGTGTFL